MQAQVRGSRRPLTGEIAAFCAASNRRIGYARQLSRVAVANRMLGELGVMMKIAPQGAGDETGRAVAHGVPVDADHRHHDQAG